MVNDERSNPNLGESGVRICNYENQNKSTFQEKNSHLKNEWEEGDVAESIDKTQLWVGVHLPHLLQQGIEYLSNTILCRW